MRGRGYGTRITQRLTELAQEKGARISLSSTTHNNAAMRHVFRRLGYAELDTVAVFPSESDFHAAVAAAPRPFSSGEDFLDALGALGPLRSLAGSATAAFAPCTGAGAAKAATALAAASATRDAGELVGLGLLPAEYRVYAPTQAGRAAATTAAPRAEPPECLSDEEEASERGGGRALFWLFVCERGGDGGRRATVTEGGGEGERERGRDGEGEREREERHTSRPW